MIDFLRANPFVSINDYMYKLSIAKIHLMSRDFTHVEYLSDKQSEWYKKRKKSKVVIRKITDFF